jgi:Fe2+ transport system protein FeoA
MKEERTMTNINLVEAPPNSELEVIEIDAGTSAKQRLISMGVHAGDKIIKYNGSSWGPVLIKNITLDSSKIAIGRGLAAKILVGYENA